MSTKQLTLEERAERVALEMAAVRAEQERAAQAEHDRLTAHAAQHDVDLIAAYQDVKAAAEVAVEHARAELDRAVQDHPLTQAIATWHVAQAERLEVFTQYVAAIARQGRDVSGARHPYPAEFHLAEQIDRAALRMATEHREHLAADGVWGSRRTVTQ